MQRSTWIGLAMVVVVALGGLFVAQRINAPDPPSQTQSTTVTYRGEDGQTALELLRAHATVETTTDPSFGEYVTSINGVASGTNGKYWLVFVNGQAATRGAGELTTTASDAVEWKLE